MGKLMHNTHIQHSSHPHLLELSSSLQNQPGSITCAGCDLHISAGHVYTCNPCKFYLHTTCAKFPELITHPSHTEHALTLLPTSTYPGGLFRCDACGHQGSRFSYHCTFCDFDLHLLCASKPISVSHPIHPHPLQLTFSSPYGEKLGFSCDVCSNIGSSQQWLYRCVSCEFDVHLHCASSAPLLLQHHHSFPGAAPVTHPNQPMGSVAAHPLMHSMSTGSVQSYRPPPQHPAHGVVQGYQPPPQNLATGRVQSYRPPPQHPAHAGVQSYRPPPQHPAHGVGQRNRPPAPGGVQSYRPPAQPPAPGSVQSYQPPPQPPAPGNGLADAMMMGFVEGAMQQIGQNFVQGFMGGDEGGGGDGDGGDSSLF